ncbi:hypothetical protein PIB30_007777 [Stylosanthes scabra]|uniref:Uncharacterized protein n=1 Tax=Stylosanthes scabra TaxID=79078 RepID=A0ABU6Z562_9FABA|nr:hypothetical protein [Stylosanthes scabra]
MEPSLLLPLLLILLFFPSITISSSSSSSPPLPQTPSPKPSPSSKPSPSPKSSPSSKPSTPSPTSSPSSSPTPKESTSPSPSPSSSPSSSSSPLDPKQLRALESLNIPTSKNPCSPTPLHNTTTCDTSKPFRHIISLRLSNCSSYVSLSSTALKSLSPTLQSLHLFNCPHRISGVSLSHLSNLTDLSLSNLQIKASGPYVILAHMNKLKTLTISNANLTGFLPRHVHSNLTHIDLSGNQLKGSIPPSITMLDSLEILNLSSNGFKGEIPSSIGDLISLKLCLCMSVSIICWAITKHYFLMSFPFFDSAAVLTHSYYLTVLLFCLS